jgi:hypothetical protein
MLEMFNKANSNSIIIGYIFLDLRHTTYVNFSHLPEFKITVTTLQKLINMVLRKTEGLYF